MSTTNYEFDGLSAWEKQIGEIISKKYPDAFKKIVVQIAYELQGECKKLTPIKTTRLRDGWQVGKIVKKGKTHYIEVFNKVEYAAHVNYGHRTGKNGYKQGEYMLEVSLDKINARLTPFLRNWLNDFIKKNDL